MAADKYCEVCAYELTDPDKEPCRSCEGQNYESKKGEAVEHPAHYNTGNFECIDVMQEVFGKHPTKAFCLLNAFKYLYRCCSKHETPTEDVKKAVWYLNKWIELDKGANYDA